MGMQINSFGEHYEANPAHRPINSKGFGRRRWYEPAYDPFARSWMHVIVLPIIALAVLAVLAYNLLNGGLDDQYDQFTNQGPDTSCVSNEQPNTPPVIINSGKRC